MHLRYIITDAAWFVNLQKAPTPQTLGQLRKMAKFNCLCFPTAQKYKSVSSRTRSNLAFDTL